MFLKYNQTMYLLKVMSVPRVKYNEFLNKSFENYTKLYQVFRFNIIEITASRFMTSELSKLSKHNLKSFLKLICLVVATK